MRGQKSLLILPSVSSFARLSRAKIQLFSKSSKSLEKIISVCLNKLKIALASGEPSLLELFRALRFSRRSLKDRLFMSSPCGESSIFLCPTVVGVIEFYSLRSSKKSFKYIQIFQFLFVRFFRFVRYLPDRALHIPETKRISAPAPCERKTAGPISRCLGGYCVGEIMSCLGYDGLCPKGDVVGVALEWPSVGHAEQ